MASKNLTRRDLHPGQLESMLGTNPAASCKDRTCLFYVQFILTGQRKRLGFSVAANDKREAIERGWVRLRDEFEWWMGTFNNKAKAAKVTIGDVRLHQCIKIYTK